MNHVIIGESMPSTHKNTHAAVAIDAQGAVSAADIPPRGRDTAI